MLEEVVEEETKSAIFSIGEGRGFVVEHGFVLTAAHCLPLVPESLVVNVPAHRAAYAHEKTVLIGGRVFAEVLFVDPVSDVAVIGRPDDELNTRLWDHFMDDRPWLKFAKKPTSSVKLRYPDGWRYVELTPTSNSLIGECNSLGGMSGSPILNRAGKVVGLVSTTGSHPRLPHCLPRWI